MQLRQEDNIAGALIGLLQERESGAACGTTRLKNSIRLKYLWSHTQTSLYIHQNYNINTLITRHPEVIVIPILWCVH